VTHDRDRAQDHRTPGDDPAVVEAVREAERALGKLDAEAPPAGGPRRQRVRVDLVVQWPEGEGPDAAAVHAAVYAGLRDAFARLGASRIEAQAEITLSEPTRREKPPLRPAGERKRRPSDVTAVAATWEGGSAFLCVCGVVVEVGTEAEGCPATVSGRHERARPKAAKSERNGET
jgi:hypothetical protein